MIPSLQARYPNPFPPPFADAWGDDEYGLWAEFHLFAAGGERPVIQRLRWIEPGTFWMGSPDNEPECLDWEGAQHSVTLTRGYWLADTVCTQALWRVVLGNNPSRFNDNPERPVEQVDWWRVQDFLRVLESLLPGVRPDLPTEAEWEYACRAGTHTPYSFGENITPEQVNYNGVYPYNGGNKGAYRRTTVPVKCLPANPWGLYEMHGNVWEWCADVMRTYTPSPVTDPKEMQTGNNVPHVVRGGAWGYKATFARSAYRGQRVSVDARSQQGFRLCLRPIEPGPDSGRAAGAAPKVRGGEAGG